MTSLAVAEKATSPVIQAFRTLLWGDGVVEFKIPPRAKPGHYGEGDVRVDFIHFAYAVPGGMINVFVHGTGCMKFINKTVTAKAQIYRKDLPDGRSFLHVDLIPANEKPTHWINVRGKKVGVTFPSTAIVFDTPSPLKGEIGIAPLKK